jgi:hypothetical protein
MRTSPVCIFYGLRRQTISRNQPIIEGFCPVGKLLTRFVPLTGDYQQVVSPHL